MKSSFIEKLRKDINIVSDEVSDLLHKEDVFQNRVKKLIENDSIDLHIKSVLIQNHYSTAFTSVRRQLGTKSGEVSLLSILLRLAEHHKLITKEWYAEEWLKESSLMHPDHSPELKIFVQNIPNLEFERNFGQDHLDKARVELDLDKLKHATESVKKYVDKRIAHRDKGAVVSVSEKEYLASLKLIEALTKKYILLLNQVGMIGLKPVIQD